MGQFRRRQLLFVASALLAAPFAVKAQSSGKVYRIGCLFLRAGPSSVDEAFLQGMRELGYIEGRNLSIEYRWAAGNQGRLPELALELVRLNVDVIVGAANPPIEAAKRATNTIPIVMAVVSDPVDTGLVSSLARPGGNVTGMTLMTGDLAGKRLQLLRELIPEATRVALLTTYASDSRRPVIEQMLAAARQLGIQLLVQTCNKSEELPSSFAAMRQQGVQGIILPISPFLTNNMKRVLELTLQHRLPTMYEVPGLVDQGGLVSYGPSTVEMYRRAALYVDKILKGAKPAELPVEQPTKFELVINTKTAKALGIKIPQSILLRADRVIE